MAATFSIFEIAFYAHFVIRCHLPLRYSLVELPSASTLGFNLVARWNDAPGVLFLPEPHRITRHTELACNRSLAFALSPSAGDKLWNRCAFSDSRCDQLVSLFPTHTTPRLPTFWLGTIAKKERERYL